MINGINGNNISSLQLFKASQAFKKYSEQPIDKAVTPVEDKDVKLSISSNQNDENKTKISKTAQEMQAEIQRKQYLNKIKEHTNTDISEDDLKYALKFGRSVLVNRLA